MNKINTILLKYECNNSITLINKLKQLKINFPSFCYNIGTNIFKLEVKKTEDKEEYRKNFVIEDFYKLKLYYYKIKINNNIYKTYQIEQLIKEQTKLKNTVSRYCYQGVDTGIFFITTTQKIKRSKRIIKIKNKTFRIECMNNEEINNYEVNWKEIGIRKQEKINHM